MSKRDVCDLIRLLENHKVFTTCKIENCKKCDEIKRFGKALWDKKQVEKKEPLQRTATLTTQYYSNAVMKGYRRAEIAEAFGMTKSQMSYWLVKNEVKHGDILKNRDAEIVKRMEEGCSYGDMAFRYSLSEDAIRSIIYKKNDRIDKLRRAVPLAKERQFG